MRLRLRYLAISSLLLTFGILFLLNNFGVFYNFSLNEGWSTLMLLWPLIFVFAALYFIFKGSKVNFFIVPLIFIFIALILFSLFYVYNIRLPFLPSINRVTTTNPNITFSSDSKNYINSIKKANLVFRSSRGDFYLRGTTDSLTEYDAKSTFGQYLFEKSEKDGIATVDLRFDEERVPWKITSEKNSLDLKLNPKPVWNLDYDISSSTLDMDLGYYTVEKTRVKLSSSTANISLEERTIDKESAMELDATTSTVNIRVEKNIGIELKLKSTISTKDLGDMEEVETNVFRTKDFDKKDKRLIINSDMSFSRLKIEQF